MSRVSRVQLKVIDKRELDMKKLIGEEGQYAAVFKGVWKHAKVAIKQWKIPTLTEETEKIFLQEASILLKLDSSNLTRLFAVCLDPPCLVMEYMPNGTLYAFLRGRSPISWDTKIQIAVDIGAGLKYLHQQEPPILHRNLNSRHVLLNSSRTAKLTNFGFAEVKQIVRLKEKRETRDAEQGSINNSEVAWAAPELLRRSPIYSTKSDVYAYGIVLWEIASRKTPFQEYTATKSLLLQTLNEDTREPIPDDTPSRYARVVEQCWLGRAKERPDVRNALKSLQSLKENTDIGFSTASEIPVVEDSLSKRKEPRRRRKDKKAKGTGRVDKPADLLIDPLQGIEPEEIKSAEAVYAELGRRERKLQDALIKECVNFESLEIIEGVCSEGASLLRPGMLRSADGLYYPLQLAIILLRKDLVNYILNKVDRTTLRRSDVQDWLSKTIVSYLPTLNDIQSSDTYGKLYDNYYAKIPYFMGGALLFESSGIMGLIRVKGENEKQGIKLSVLSVYPNQSIPFMGVPSISRGDPIDKSLRRIWMSDKKGVCSAIALPVLFSLGFASLIVGAILAASNDDGSSNLLELGTASAFFFASVFLVLCPLGISLTTCQNNFTRSKTTIPGILSNLTQFMSRKKEGIQAVCDQLGERVYSRPTI